ncbi:MAG: urease accessory protein UreE [Cyanobacteriota bacterium]|nr:urease accessory protein UreE [Cyanobacteriota bacterium]
MGEGLASNPLLISHKADPADHLTPTHSDTVTLPWIDRQRIRQRLYTQGGRELLLALPRGSTLQAGDLLYQDSQLEIRVVAQPEDLLHITPTNLLELGRVAHHLGNWHRPAQCLPDGTLLAENDSPLQDWLHQQGIPFDAVRQPFQPNLTGHFH